MTALFIHRNGQVQIRKPVALPPGESYLQEAHHYGYLMATETNPSQDAAYFTITWFLKSEVHGVQIWKEVTA